MKFRLAKVTAVFAIGAVALLVTNSYEPANAQSKPGVQSLEVDQTGIHGARARQILLSRGKTATPIQQPFATQSFGTAGINAPEGAEVTELARALHYDVDLIFEYVRDQISFDRSWGAKRGAVGTLLDKRGNPFDQAQLMVELLRASGYTASYVLGEKRFWLTDLQEIFNITTNQFPPISDFFSGSGAPVFVYVDGSPQDNVIALDLTTVWVKVNIGGTDYVFDPTFVPQNHKTAIDLVSATGYDRTAFLADALSGAVQTSDYIQNVNRAGIRADLTTYATNLVSYLRTNMPGATLDDVIGGSSPQPLNGPVRDTSVPLQQTVLDEWTGDIPAAYQTLFRVQLPGIDHTFETREIYGKRLTLIYNGSNQPVLRLNGTTVATGTAGTIGSPQTVTIDVDHPYAAFNGTFADQTGQSNALRVGGSFVIATAWGFTGRGVLEKHQKRLREYRAAGFAENSEEVLGEALALVGQNFLAENWLSVEAMNRANRVARFYTHNIGVVGLRSEPFIDFFMNPFTGRSLDDIAEEPSKSASFWTGASRGSALEHAALEQHQAFNAISTVKLFDIANLNNDPIFDVTSANYAAIRPQLVGYSAAQLDDFQSDVDNGERVLIPQNGSYLIDQWSGGAWLVIRTNGTVAYQIDGGLKGGNATTLGPMDLNEFTQTTYFANNWVGHLQVHDPIDFVSGNYLSNNVDISIGSAKIPIGLALERTYNSENRLVDGPLGLGWTHSFDITARPASNGFQTMGEDSPVDAAASIVATLVAFDLYKLAKTKDILVTGTLIDRWLADQITDNVVEVFRPGDGGHYVKLPDGTYNPPPGVAANLTEAGGLFTLRTAEGTTLDFNADGNISLWEDPNGNQLTFNYGAGGRLDSVSNSFGRTLTFNYVGNRIDNITDGTGRSVSYSYDASGNLISFTDGENHATTYEYDIPGRLTKIFKPANPLNPFVTSTYDTLDRVMEQANGGGHIYKYYFAGSRSEEEDPLGNSHIAYFDRQGDPIREIDQLGNETVTAYDGERRPTARTLPEGNQTAFEYDANHNVTKRTVFPKPGSLEPPLVEQFTYGTNFNRLTSKTDALNRTTNYFYDSNGNLEHTDYPQVESVTPQRVLTYNAQGQVLTDTAPDGLVTRFTYDPANGNLLDTIVDDGGFNITTTNGYDAVGNVTSVTDPNGNTTTTVFDNERRPTLQTSPTPFNFQTKTFYFPDGLVQSVERETGDVAEPWQVNSFTYTVSGKRASAADPAGDLTTFDYDELDRLVTTTDPELRVKEIEYDPDNRVSKVYQNIGGLLTQIEGYQYTANGRKQAVIDGANHQTNFVYDDFDRLQQTVFPDTTFEQLTYDAAGNVLQRRTRAGDLIDFTYDNLNRVLTEKEANNPATEIDFTYNYDLAGRLETATTTRGTYTRLYDTAGRLTDVTDPNLRTISYDYDLAGNRTRLDYPDGYFVTYTYDEMNRLTAIKESGATDLAVYSYDPLSRRTGVTYENGASSSYQFEIDNDLKQVAQTFSGGTVTYDYLYNGAGQKISQTVSDEAHLWRPGANAATSYTPGGLNAYDAVDGVAYAYDANGNLTDNGQDTYTYDAKNQLIQADVGATTADYSFDYTGLRIEKTVDATTTQFLYDGANVIAEYDGSGALIARYVRGPGLDRPVLMDRGIDRYFYHFDGVGSVSSLSGSVGSETDAYAYGPFGQVSASASIDNPYRFAARRFDDETGLYYYRARTYSVALGRFLQPDPTHFADGLNLYVYVANDPLNLVDPSGLESRLAITTGVAGGYWYFAGDAGGLFLVDTNTGTVDAFGYVAVGGGLGFGGVASAEVGFIDFSNIEDVTGLGGAYSFYAGAGAAVSGTGFGSYSPGDGGYSYGSVIGPGYGWGIGGALLASYTFYLGKIDLADLSETARDALDDFISKHGK